MSHILKPKSGGQYANLVPSCINAMCILASEKMAGIDIVFVKRCQRVMSLSPGECCIRAGERVITYTENVGNLRPVRVSQT